MRIHQMRLLLLLFFCVQISCALLAMTPVEGDFEYFRLDPLTDSFLLGGGLLLNAGDMAVEKISEPAEGWTLDTLPDIPTINHVDRLFVLPYSKPLDTASEILTYAALLAPAALFAVPDSEWLTIGVMYAESVIWTWGLKELGKNLFHRYRPYLYFDGYPPEEINNGDFQQSFPSGHTSLAFNGAGFCTFVFGTYFKDSPWKIPVITASYSLALASAVLRGASGSHFLTDVIAGAAIGTLSGFLVPWLHTLNPEPTVKAGAEIRSFSVAAIPSGIRFRMKF